jgi:chorismate dehydratase
MVSKYSVSLVSYLNTTPFLYSLQHAAIAEKIQLHLDVPADGAQKLLNNQIDIGLVPVAVLAKLPDAKIITDYCIGADGKVSSVCVYSNVPMEKIKMIYLDNHSYTSVQLLKILLKDYWHYSPIMQASHDGYADDIFGDAAGLFIGDKCLALKNKYVYEYDLAEAWKNLTGLPFVFAAWITRKNIPDNFIFELNEALKAGVNNIVSIIDKINLSNYSRQTIVEYLTQNISYHFDSKKQEALELFLKELGVLSQIPVID